MGEGSISCRLRRGNDAERSGGILLAVMAADLEQLLGRTMVLVAHPDDECITSGGLLQRMSEPVVVYATDGSPQDPYFWKKHGSREAYTRLRQEEARRALARVGVREILFLANREPMLVDQELFKNLGLAFELLVDEAKRREPEAVLTLAYEGGHPDHDSCSLLASELGKVMGIPVWEAPLYRRRRSELSVQEFVEPNGKEIPYVPSAGEIERKRQMCLEYPSQGDFLQVFGLEREMFRPQKEYDYSQRPHEGKLNYEEWQWSMTGEQVSGKFVEFQRGRKVDPSLRSR
jgi:N-acetylglucosamine malate deacetylase 2